MTTVKLLGAFIGRRPLTWVFHLLILAASVAVVVSVLLLRDAAETRLRRDLADVDLIVGAKGGPLQLMMSALLHVDAPTGNIPLAEAERLARDPQVAVAAPISLGDSVRGQRIVGVSRTYPALYDARIARGRWWAQPMEAVLGAKAAARLDLGPGDLFQGEHGLAGGDAVHSQPYRVVGVLEPTGAVIDRLVLTDLESVWRLHEEEEGDHHAAEHADADRQVTAVLVRYRSPLGAVTVPRRVAASPDLIAASPAREATRLNALAGVGADTLTALGAAFLTLSVLGFVIALSAAVLGRRRDLAVLRALGAGSGKLIGILVAEGLTLGLCAGGFGLLLARLGLAWVSARTPTFDLPIAGLGPLDLTVVGLAGVLGGLAALGPAVHASRADPAPALAGEGR